jgi:hypothetical protein
MRESFALDDDLDDDDAAAAEDASDFLVRKLRHVAPFDVF